MARPQAPEYDDRRQLILDEAARLIAADGFHKASMSGIAAACNVSKAALYHYFPSKEAILYSILADHTELLLDTVRRVAAGDGSGEARLRELSRELMAIYVHSTDRHVVLLNGLGALPELQHKRIVALQNEIVETVASILETVNPELAGDRLRRRPATMIFMGMINWTYTWFRESGPMSPEAFADLVTDVALGGLPALDGRSRAAAAGDGVKAIPTCRSG
jgi:AcrR family transcriptional regulator